MRVARASIVLASVLATFVVAPYASMGCRKKTEDPKPPPPPVVVDAIATMSAPPPGIPAACAVAYATYPSGGGPSSGDDLSSVPVPLRVPAGANLTISVRRTGHEVRIRGPAIVRPCTHDEPDVVLLASGEASTDRSNKVAPGAELFLATPAFVAVVGRATLRLSVTSGIGTWELDEGEATITNLDVGKIVTEKDRGTYKRFEDGGLLLTRCGVQAASAASAERLLLGLGGDAAVPLPSASIGILTAQQIKHAREKVLDCAFAQAFAMACDYFAEPKEGQETGSPYGCGHTTYLGVREHIARSTAASPIPPGSPLPPGSASGK